MLVGGTNTPCGPQTEGFRRRRGLILDKRRPNGHMWSNRRFRCDCVVAGEKCLFVFGAMPIPCSETGRCAGLFGGDAFDTPVAVSGCAVCGRPAIEGDEGSKK
jgi:hypothetical protein